MQQVDRGTAPAAVSGPAGAAPGYASFSSGTLESRLSRSAADVARNRASTALTIEELRAKFHRRCLQLDGSVEHFAVRTPATGKNITARGSAGAVAASPRMTSTKRCGTYSNELGEKRLTSTSSINLSYPLTKVSPRRDSNTTACSLQKGCEKVSSRWGAATGASVMGCHGDSEVASTHHRKGTPRRCVNHFFPPTESWCNSLEVHPRREMSCASAASFPSATDSAPAGNSFAEVGAYRETPVNPGADIMGARCPWAASFKGGTFSGGRIPGQGLKAPDIPDVVDHGSTSSALQCDYRGNTVARVPGRAEFRAVVADEPIATSPHDVMECASKAPTTQLPKHEKTLNLRRHHGPCTEDAPPACTFEQSSTTDALTSQHPSGMEQSSYSPRKPRAPWFRTEVSPVSSADDGYRDHVGAKSKQRLSPVNRQLFSHSYPRSSLAAQALHHIHSERQEKQRCKLQRGQDPQCKNALLPHLPQQQKSSCQQQQHENNNTREKVKRSPGQPMVDVPEKIDSRTAPQRQLLGRSSLSSSSPASVSSTLVCRPPSAFSSAVSSPAATSGGDSNRTLLAHPNAAAAGTTELRWNGSSSPSLRGMAQNLNSIRNGLLRAVEETRQSFMRLRLPPEKLKEGRKPLKKESTSRGNVGARSSTTSGGTKTVHSNGRHLKRGNRSTFLYTVDSNVDNSSVTAYNGDCQNIKKDNITKDCRVYHEHARHSNTPSLATDPPPNGEEQTRREEQHEEQVQGQAEQSPQWQEAPRDHLQTQQPHQRHSYYRRSANVLHYQALEKQQKEAPHQRPQQQAKGFTLHSVERRGDNGKRSDNEEQSSEEPNCTKCPRDSAEGRRGRRDGQEHSTGLQQQEQSLKQGRHTKPPRLIDMAKIDRGRNWNTASSFTSDPGEDACSDGTSRTVGQTWTPVSSVGAAEADSSFSTPQVSYFASPQTAGQDFHQSGSTAVGIAEQPSPRLALSPSGTAAATVTSSGVLSRTAAGHSAHSNLPGHAASSKDTESPSSLPATSTAAAVRSGATTGLGGTTMLFKGEQQHELVNKSEIQSPRATDGKPHGAPQPHRHLQPNQPNKAEVEKRDTKLTSKDGNSRVVEQEVHRVLLSTSQHNSRWQLQNCNRVTAETKDTKASSQERNSKMEEQESRSNWVSLSSRQQLSRHRETLVSSVHVPDNVDAASPLASSPSRQGEGGPNSSSRSGSSKRCNIQDDSIGLPALHSEDPSTRTHLLTKQRPKPSGSRSDFQVNPPGTNTYGVAFCRRRPSRKISAGAKSDLQKGCEENAPGVQQLQLAKRQDSLQLSPSSCWDIYTSRSGGTPTLGNHRSRPQSGSSEGGHSFEEQPDHLPLGMQRNRGHPRIVDSSRQHEQQHAMQQEHATAGNREQSVYEKSQGMLSQGENPLQQHRRQQRQLHQFQEAQRRTAEMQECGGRWTGDHKERTLALKTWSSAVSTQQQQLPKQLQNVAQNPCVRRTPVLEKQKQQEQQERERAKIMERDQGSYLGARAAGHSTLQTGIRCTAVQEVEVRAHPKPTLQAEHLQRRQVEETSAINSDNDRSQGATDGSGVPVRTAANAAIGEADESSEVFATRHTESRVKPRPALKNVMNKEFQKQRHQLQQQVRDGEPAHLFKHQQHQQSETQHSQLAMHHSDSLMEGSGTQRSSKAGGSECLTATPGPSGMFGMNDVASGVARDNSAYPNTVLNEPTGEGRACPFISYAASVKSAAEAVVPSRSDGSGSSTCVQVVSTATSVSGPPVQGTHEGPQQKHQHTSEEGRNAESPEQRKGPQSRPQHGDGQSYVHQPKHQTDAPSLSFLRGSVANVMEARPAGAKLDQVYCEGQDTAPYSPASFRTRLALATADVVAAHAGEHSSSSGDASRDGGSGSRCSGEIGTRYDSSSIIESRRCTEKSTLCGNDTASSGKKASSTSPDTAVIVDPSLDSEVCDYSQVQQTCSTTPSLDARATSTGGDSNGPLSQLQHRREKHLLPQEQKYFVEHQVAHLKQHPAQAIEESKELGQHMCDCPVDHTKEDRLSAPCQERHGQHITLLEQQQQRPMCRRQQHAVTTHQSKLRDATLSLQDSFMTSENRAPTLQEQREDAKTSCALQPLAERQMLESSDAPQEGRPSLPTNPQAGVLFSALSPKSQLQWQQHLMREESGIPLQHCQSKNLIHGRQHDSVVDESKHELSAPFLSPSSLLSGEGGRQAVLVLHPPGDAPRTLLASREGVEAKNKSILRRRNVADNGCTTSTIGPKNHQIHQNSSCSCKSRIRGTLTSLHVSFAAKDNGAPEQNGMPWCNAEADATRVERLVNLREVQATTTGETEALAATPSATVDSEDASSASGGCWSHRPACGSSRRSSICGGSDRSSQRDFSSSANAYNLIRGDGGCSTDVLLGASVNFSPQEMRQGAKQQQQEPVQEQRCKEAHEDQQTKHQQQTHVQRLDRPRHCQGSHETAQYLPSVSFFSPQQVTGCSRMSASLRHLTSTSSDTPARSFTSGADGAAPSSATVVPHRLLTFQEEDSSSRREVSSTQQQDSPRRGDSQFYQQCRQHLQRKKSQTDEKLSGERGREEGSGQSDRNPSQKEADGITREAGAASGSDDAKETTCVLRVPSLAPPRRVCSAPFECNIDEDPLCTSVLGVPLSRSNNCKAIQQLGDLLDAVQLLLSVLEGNADELKYQLAKQRLFPVPQQQQESQHQADANRASLLRELQELVGRQQHQPDFNTQPTEGVWGTHNTRKKQRLRELHQQLNESLLLRNTQPLVQSSKCGGDLPSPSSLLKQAASPAAPVVDQLLKETQVKSQLQQKEKKFNLQEPGSTLQMQWQQESIKTVVCVPSAGLVPTSAAADVPVPDDEKHQGTVAGAIAHPCVTRFRSRTSSCDAVQQNVSTFAAAEGEELDASASSNFGKRGADALSLCHKSSHSFLTNYGGDEEVRNSPVPIRHVSNNTRLPAASALGCSHVEEVALHKAREAVAKAAAAAERACAAAAQAAIAAQVSRGAATVHADGAPGAPNSGAITATNPTMVETDSSEKRRTEPGMSDADPQTSAGATTKVLSGAILVLAARQTAAHLPSQHAMEQHSAVVKESLWDTLSKQQQHRLNVSLQQQNEDSPVQTDFAQGKLWPLHKHSSRPSPGHVAAAVPVGQEQSPVLQDLSPQESLQLNREDNSETEWQRQQHCRHDHPLRGGHKKVDEGTRKQEGLLGSPVTIALQEKPVHLSHLSQGRRALPQEALSELYKTPVQQKLQVSPQEQQVTPLHWLYSSPGQQQRSTAAHQQQTLLPGYHGSPGVQQLPLRGQFRPPQRNQSSPSKHLQNDPFADQGSEDARQWPPRGEQAVAQQGEKPGLSGSALQPHLQGDVETQALEKDIATVHSQAKASTQGAPSVDSRALKESDEPPVLSATSTPESARRSAGAEGSRQHLQMRRGFVPPQCHGSSLTQEQLSWLQRPQDSTLLHSHQQRDPQSEKQQPYAESQTTSSPPQCLLWSQHDQRSIIGDADKKERQQAGEELTPVQESQDEGNGLQGVLQQHHQRQGCDQFQKQSPLERLELDQPHHQSAQQLQQQQQEQNVQICRFQLGKTQPHRTAVGGSTWYSPIAADAFTDVHAFLREPAYDTLALGGATCDTAGKSIGAGADAAVADAAPVGSDAHSVMSVGGPDAVESDGVATAEGACDAFQQLKGKEGCATAAADRSMDTHCRWEPVAASGCSQPVVVLPSVRGVIHQEHMCEEQQEERRQHGYSHDSAEGRGKAIQAGGKASCFELAGEDSERPHRLGMQKTGLTSLNVTSPASAAATAAATAVLLAAACDAQVNTVSAENGLEIQLSGKSGDHLDQLANAHQQNGEQQQIPTGEQEKKQEQRLGDQEHASFGKQQEGFEGVDAKQQPNEEEKEARVEREDTQEQTRHVLQKKEQEGERPEQLEKGEGVITKETQEALQRHQKQEHHEKGDKQKQDLPRLLTDDQRKTDQQQVLIQLLEKEEHDVEENEEVLAQMQMREVCDRLRNEDGGGGGYVDALFQRDLIQTTHKQAEEVAHQHRQTDSGQCRKQMERHHVKHVVHDEKVEDEQLKAWRQKEETSDMRQRSSVDLQEEFTLSLPSISPPRCSPMHGSGLPAMETPAAFSPSATVSHASDTAAAASDSKISAGGASLATDMFCGVGALKRALAAAPATDVRQELPTGGVSTSTHQACKSDTATETERCVESKTLFTPLEQILQEKLRNLRPVPQKEYRPPSQSWAVQPRVLQQQELAAKEEEEEQQLPMEQMQLQKHQESQHGQHALQQQKLQQTSEQQPHIQERDKEAELEYRQEQQEAEEQKEQVEVLQHEQKHEQKQQARQMGQALEQHVGATVEMGNAGGKSAEGRRDRQFEPCNSLGSEAPTVDPELLSPVEAAATAGTRTGTGFSTALPRSTGAASGGHSLKAAAIAARATSTAPSPSSLPPVVKQQQCQRQQYSREVHQQKQSSLPEDTTTAATAGAVLRTEDVSHEHLEESAGEVGVPCIPSSKPSAGDSGGEGGHIRLHHLRRRRTSPIDTSSDIVPNNNTVVVLGRMTKKSRVHVVDGTGHQEADAFTIRVSGSSVSAASSSVPVLATGPSVHLSFRPHEGTSTSKRRTPEEMQLITTDASKVAETLYAGQILDTARRKFPSGEEEAKYFGATESRAVLGSRETNINAVPIAAKQETAAGAPAEAMTGANAGGSAEGNVSATPEITAGRESKRTAIREECLKGGTVRRGSTSLSLQGAVVSKPVEPRNTSFAQDVPPVPLVCKDKEEGTGVVADTTHSSQTSGAEGASFDEAREKDSSTTHDKERKAGPVTKEEHEKEDVEKSTPDLIVTSNVDRRRRRHSFGAVVLRLSGKYRQSSRTNKVNHDNDSQGKKKSSTGRRTSTTSDSLSSNIEGRIITSTTTATADQSTGDNSFLLSQRRQETTTSVVKESVNNKDPGQTPTIIPPPKAADVASVKTSDAGNGGAQTVKEEVHQLTSSKGVNTKGGETKNGTVANNSRNEEVKRTSTTKALPAAHAPPASMQPRLSYPFFKSHARQQQLRQQKKQEHQQQQPEQQQQQLQPQKSLRQLLLHRRKSLSGSSSAEGFQLGQLPGEISALGKQQQATPGSSGDTTLSSAAVQEMPSSTSSLPFLSRRFCSVSASAGAATTPSASAAPAASSLPVAAVPPASANSPPGSSSALTASFPPPTAASAPPTSAGFSVAAVMAAAGTSCVTSCCDGSSNASSAFASLSSTGSSTSGDGGSNTHLKIMKKQKKDLNSSTIISGLTTSASIRPPTSWASVGTIVPASTVTSAASATAAAVTTEGKVHPAALSRRSTAASHTSTLVFSSSGCPRFTAAAAPSAAITSIAAAAAAARSAPATTAASTGSTVGPVFPDRNSCSRQAQHVLTSGIAANSASVEWSMGGKSSSSSSSSLYNSGCSTTQGASDEQRRQSTSHTLGKHSGDLRASGKKLPRLFGFHFTSHASRQQA